MIVTKCDWCGEIIDEHSVVYARLSVERLAMNAHMDADVEGVSNILHFHEGCRHSWAETMLAQGALINRIRPEARG